MKTKLLYLFLLFITSISFSQNAGIFQTYAIIDSGSGNTYYAGGINSDGASNIFSGQDFATPTSLILNGGEIKTFKNNGGDVTGAELNYRVYLQGTTPGSFTTISLPFGANLGGGDQRWESTSENIDLLQNITSVGNYIVEVFWKITTNIGDMFDSNSGSNYSASFVISSLNLNQLNSNDSKIFIKDKELNINSVAEINNISVYSLLGQKVFSKKYNNQKTVFINLKTKPKGIYVVKISSGTQTKTFKVVLD